MSSDDADAIEGEHRSIWLETSPETEYDALEDGLSVDVAVIGGGVAGVTAAAKLREAGRSVALVERDRILAGVTGHTTAKLTSLHGLVYDHIVEHFGEERARQYAEANQAAIDDVESTVEERDVDCGFERAPAYTYVESADDRDGIEAEVAAAERLDLPASLVESPDLPFDAAAAVRFDDQGLFHPRKYLLALAETIPGEDGHVFERTRATDVEDGSPCEVSTDRGSIEADDVVVATHFPVFDEARYYERLYPKRSYVLAVELADAGDVPEGMYYQPQDPYFSVRPAPAGKESMVLVGGQPHRTGHGGSTVERYRALREAAFDRLDVDEIAYRWSTQDFVSVDGVPFVGPLGPESEHVYAATGFGGWGMTNGIAAGAVLRDLIVDGDSEWADVYRPNRFAEDASRPEFGHHNAHDVKHYLEDPGKDRPDGADAVGRGEGAVVDRDGPTAVYRDDEGEVHAVSAVCPHMGCLVHWNDAERSWDCPCHGSRFDVDGTVLNGPANGDLEDAE